MHIILDGVSCALFAWFFAYCIDNVPYLKWYGFLLSKLPENLSKPLGFCPYCFAPWFYILTLFLPHEIVQVAYAFGWTYAASSFFDKFISTDT
jgi:hypothetical protein